MRERYEMALKIACAILAALLLAQVVRVAVRRNPLAGLKIPAVPVLAADAPDGAKATNSPPASGVAAQKTNAARADAKSTNSIANLAAGKAGTNLISTGSAEKAASNSVAPQKMAKDATNSVSSHAPGKTETNMFALAASGRNGTNIVAGTNSAAGTNSTARRPGGGARPDMAMMMGMNPFGRPGGKKAAELAPAIQARVDKITDSEILGPVFHPQPIGLLGIVGNVAFLRGASGQTGMVKEGDEMGGLKLLRIGINRVLVEQDGQKKELMIFSGYGGETLMPKENGKTNEITTKTP